MMELTFVQLCRYGDILNILPACKELGYKINMVIHKDFASILDGCSYVEATPIECGLRDVKFAESWAKERFNHVIVSQVDGNNKISMKGTNFTLAQWKNFHAELKAKGENMVVDYHSSELIIDQRDVERERQLMEKHEPRPILVNLKSHSSPFTGGLMRFLKHYYGDQILDLSTVKAENFYDLLVYYDLAKVLVTVDTATLHLANCKGNRTNHIPTIALSRPDLWYGSETRSFWKARFYYNSVNPERVKHYIDQELK